MRNRPRWWTTCRTMRGGRRRAPAFVRVLGEGRAQGGGIPRGPLGRRGGRGIGRMSHACAGLARAAWRRDRALRERARVCARRAAGRRAHGVWRMGRLRAAERGGGTPHERAAHADSGGLRARWARCHRHRAVFPRILRRACRRGHEAAPASAEARKSSMLRENPEIAAKNPTCDALRGSIRRAAAVLSGIVLGKRCAVCRGVAHSGRHMRRNCVTTSIFCSYRRFFSGTGFAAARSSRSAWAGGSSGRRLLRCRSPRLRLVLTRGSRLRGCVPPGRRSNRSRRTSGRSPWFRPPCRRLRTGRG